MFETAFPSMRPMARQKYSEEHKREAVAMTRLPGVTITGVAKDLGINAHMLGRWRKLLEEHGEKAFPGQGHARDEELMQLKRGNDGFGRNGIF